MHTWDVITLLMGLTVLVLASKDLIKIYLDCQRRRARRKRMEAKHGDGTGSSTPR